MHKIKRQAKRNAWYNEDGSRNLNPFGKMLWRMPSSVRRVAGQEDAEADLENGLNRSQTDGDVLGLSAAEEQRKSEYDGDQIHHAATVPTDDALHPPADPQAEQSTEQAEESEKSNTESSKTAVADSRTDTGASSNGVRKRKMGGFLSTIHAGSTQDEPVDDEDEKPKQKFTVWSQFQNTIFNSPINILLLLAPIGIALEHTNVNKIAVFVVNFIAIIPLAGLLSFATEEISLRTGETIGGLLNATFG